MKEMVFVDFTQGKERVKQFLSKDKNDGLAKVYYTWDQATNDIMAFDTEEILNLNIERYSQQGINLSKSLDVIPATLEKMGVKMAKVHVYRSEDTTVAITGGIDSKGEAHIDYCGVAFDYYPANCETTIIEVEF